MTASRPHCQRRLRIAGRVQGVGYRDWFTDAAVGLGLDGWVRNRRDGTVEALVEGDEGTIARLIEAARQGPRMSRVVSIDVSPASEPLDARGFSRRATE